MLKKTVKKLRGGIKKNIALFVGEKKETRNNIRQISAQRIIKRKHYCIRTNWKLFLRASGHLAPGV